MKIVIEIQNPDLARKLDLVLAALSKMETIIMATLADIQADVASETTVIDSVVTLLSGLHDQLVAALAANDPAALQAVVDSLVQAQGCSTVDNPSLSEQGEDAQKHDHDPNNGANRFGDGKGS